nr:phosphoadenylyl-sulfate reductase [Burkholderiales bacterium]
HGINAFFKSIDLRKGCCAIRKVEPLRRALQGKKLWITGLRRQQSVTRENLDLLLFDGDNGLFKLNPLFDWSAKEVSEYVRVQDVPVNELHAQGYPSVGCAPCTRAVQQGEDERAGRWWWEQAESRECGLHMDPDGRLVRAVSRLAPESKQLTKGRSQ